jgi:hypothetical protein
MPACLVINVLSICAFFKQRKANEHSRKTVDKYGSNLLIICISELVLHVACLSTDVSLWKVT